MTKSGIVVVAVNCFPSATCFRYLCSFMLAVLRCKLIASMMYCDEGTFSGVRSRLTICGYRRENFSESVMVADVKIFYGGGADGSAGFRMNWSKNSLV